MGNSLYLGVAVACSSRLLIGSLASFAIGRMRLRRRLAADQRGAADLCDPASFLAIPFYKIMHHYGLVDTRWAVIATEVTFATPYAIFIFSAIFGE